jgi:hypothetical protein
MQSWDAIGVTEKVTRTYILPAVMRAANITISSAAVAQSVYRDASATPPTILDGSHQVNSASFTYKGQTIAIGQAILQGVKGSGGVAGGRYVITFTMVLSTGEQAFVEDVLQPVSTYVPP